MVEAATQSEAGERDQVGVIFEQLREQHAAAGSDVDSFIS